jgi:hypothetical protein
MQAEALTETQNMQTTDSTTNTIMYNLRPPSPPDQSLETSRLTEEQITDAVDRSRDRMMVRQYLEQQRQSAEQISFSQQRIAARQRLEEYRQLTQENIEKERQRQDRQAERDRRIAAIDNNFTPGEFLYIDIDGSREMIKNGFQAVQLTETADFVKSNIESFQWSGDNRIWVITAKMEELGFYGHSGCSFGWTMRQLQQIFRLGEAEYRRQYLTEKIKKEYQV